MAKQSNSQVLTCKAAVCWGPDQPVKVEEIQVEPPKSSEVRIKMLYASCCHTDIICAKGFPAPVFPRALGHEGVGVVESIGDGVEGLKEGDIVMPALVGECQECENCKSGKTNLCFRYPLMYSGLMLDGTSRMSVKGQPLYHLLTCSTWSEYTVIDANYVVKIDPSFNLPFASFLSCGFSTGFGAAWKDAKVEKGSTVAVLGLGAVGLGAIAGARTSGASKIIGIDINSMKKEKGEAYGMTDFINPNEDNNKDKPTSQLIKDLTYGMGVDYCFECTGVASLINQAIGSAKLGKGTTVLVGAATQPVVQIDFANLMCAGSVKGTVFGGLQIKSDMPILLEKCKNKEFDLDELLTHEIPLEDIEKLFDLVMQPDCVKILIKL